MIYKWYSFISFQYWSQVLMYGLIQIFGSWKSWGVWIKHCFMVTEIRVWICFCHFHLKGRHLHCFNPLSLRGFFSVKLEEEPKACCLQIQASPGGPNCLPQLWFGCRKWERRKSPGWLSASQLEEPEEDDLKRDTGGEGGEDKRNMGHNLGKIKIRNRVEERRKGWPKTQSLEF